MSLFHDILFLFLNGSVRCTFMCCVELSATNCAVLRTFICKKVSCITVYLPIIIGIESICQKVKRCVAPYP